MMAIRLKIGLQRIQSRSGLTDGGKWFGCLLKEDVHDGSSEYGELKPLQQNYTSLRDLIVVSSTKRGLGSRGQPIEWCDETRPKFKNNLLQLAARAYLQPVCKESRQEVHFIVQCWMAFVARNKTLIASVVEGLQKQLDVCAKFFRAQTFNLMQIFKPHHQTASLQMRLT